MHSDDTRDSRHNLQQRKVVLDINGKNSQWPDMSRFPGKAVASPSLGDFQNSAGQGPKHPAVNEPCFEQEVGLDDPETPYNINFSVISHLYLVHAGDMSPCRVTGFGVTIEIDQHLSCKENTGIYNTYNRTKNSKAISSLHIFFVLS